MASEPLEMLATRFFRSVDVALPGRHVFIVMEDNLDRDLRSAGNMWNGRSKTHRCA